MHGAYPFSDQDCVILFKPLTLQGRKGYIEPLPTLDGTASICKALT